MTDKKQTGAARTTRKAPALELPPFEEGKPAKSPADVQFPRKSIPVYRGKTQEETSRNYAEAVTSPEISAWRIMGTMQSKDLLDEIDVPTMLTVLRDQTDAVKRGDLTRAEAMLMNQAEALQSIFVRLSERAVLQDRMPNIEGFMRMALRAQSQCRATLETLAAIKNPPIVYARQANVTTGPQQINNGMPPPRARKNETEQTQLSGESHELPPDARASGDAIRVDSALETLGEIDRSEVPRG